MRSFVGDERVRAGRLNAVKRFMVDTVSAIGSLL